MDYTSYNLGGITRVATAAELPGSQYIELTPNVDDTIPMLRTRAAKTGARIPTGYDIWLTKEGEGRIVSTQDIITFYNNTDDEFVVCLMHKIGDKGTVQNDLYTLPLKKIPLSQQEYTASLRFTDTFEIALVVCKDKNGKRVFPQFPGTSRVCVNGGRGDFRIDYAPDNCGSFKAGLVANVGTPNVNDRELRITKHNSTVTCEIGLFKEGQLIRMYVLDHAATCLKLVLPDLYAAAIYSYYKLDNSLSRIGEYFDVVPGKVYWFSSGPENEVMQSSSSNRNLLWIPSSDELAVIEDGNVQDPNY